MLGTLRAHGLDARGLDLVNADVTGDVADALAVAKAVEGCRSLAFQPMPWPFGGSVLHTAGLHAPNLDYYSAEEFERVNVEGTRRLLEACRPISAPLVFSSTTSLSLGRLWHAAEHLRRHEEEGGGAVPSRRPRGHPEMQPVLCRGHERLSAVASCPLISMIWQLS